MKTTPFPRIEDMDLYEALDVGRDATAEEIVKAYRRARDAYGPGSMTSYGLLADDERRSMQEKIEMAFQTLGDEERRRDYDEATFGDAGTARPGAALRRTVERLEIGDAERKMGFAERLKGLFRRPRSD